MAVTARDSKAPKHSRISAQTLWRIRDVSLGYTLLAPALILLAVFEFYPLFLGAYISMCDWKIGVCTQFVLFDNYVRAFNDPGMWKALLITVTYAVISVPVQLGLAIVIAYLLFQKIKGQQWFRMLYFMPYITITVASAAVWAYLFSPDLGLINQIIKGVGLQPLRWLIEGRGIFQLIGLNMNIDLPAWAYGPSLSLISIIIYTTWVFVGYDTVIFLAGLGNIPNELYDAAKVDGASGFKLFRYITFPLLSPTSFFLLLITVIGTFKAFNHIYIMTNGGPGDATTTLAIYIFKQLVVNSRYSYSAALSFIVFILILVLTVVQNQVAGKRVVYD
jgi:multiple sugar transport system permease protein